MFAVVLALVGAGCASNDNSTVEGPPSASATAAASSSPATFSGSTFAFTLKADNDGSRFYFEPSSINAAKGATATITLHNVGTVEHNLSIPSAHVDKDVEAGKTVTVSVPLGSGATVPFFCKYHKGSGMTGAFTLR